MLTLYGIPNCNTVKKAIDWLKKNEIEFQFHDYKKKGIDETKLKEWIAQIGWEKLVNKRGTTWKGLDETIQNSIISETTAIALMMSKTSVIKRPLIESNNTIAALGYDEKEYENAFYE
ncbi:ArsC family reductase [Parasediminibacterium paludis]|uniref:ArsC family reductase n=1 Tax=Parasediminibacterium paludis TaxID=908966 RepID=A0ABV8PV48_9BACT